ncbi:hypothetical protein PC123_g24066 [Phytophthora cactorum]|nr:hypothetical protein PC123_g24066 [Phytophthora cactorum]
MDKVNKIQGTTEIPARVCLSESANGQTLNVNTDPSDGSLLKLNETNPLLQGSPSTLSVAPTSTSELVRENKSAATTYINCETPVALSAKTLQGCQLLRVLTEVPRGSTGHSSVTTDWGRQAGGECDVLTPNQSSGSLNWTLSQLHRFGESADVWLLALFNSYYEDYVTALSALRYKDKIIIDLSADAGFGGSFGRL